MKSRFQPVHVALMLLEAGLLLFIALRLGGYAQRAWEAITFVYPLDYGEGPLLSQTIQLSNLENIYPSNINTPPFTVTNYTPLFMLVQVPFVLLFGPAYWYGRLIAVFSGLAAALFNGLIIYTLTTNRRAAIFSGLIFLSTPYVAMWSTYSRVDTLALALSMAGLWVVVRWGRSAWGVGAAAMLLLAAVYTRQTYGLAAPLAAFVWSLFHLSRRRAFLLAGLVAVCGIGLFTLINLFTNGGFYFNIVTVNVNAYSVEQALHFFSQVWLLMPGLIVLSVLYVGTAVWAGQHPWWLITPYLLGAMLVGLTIGKVGASVNYLLELSAALSLAVGVLLAWQRHQPWLYAGLILLLTLQVAWLWVGLPSHILIEPKLTNPNEQRRLMTIFEQNDGPILADESLGFLPLTQHTIYIQPFEVTQLANDGIWDQSLFLASIQRQEFSHIVMLKASPPQSIAAETYWTAQMIANIEQYYVPTTVLAGSTVVYVPR